MSEGARDEEHEHEGSFAEGQESQEHHPEAEHEGDFAEGQENDVPEKQDPAARDDVAEDLSERPARTVD